MSHAHIRAPKLPADPAAKVRFWPIGVLAVVLGLPAVIFSYGRIVDSANDTTHLTTLGAISDTRVVVDNLGNSSYGGWIHYHLEAHVAFKAEGHPYDQWLRVPQFDSSHAALEAVRARHPQNCQVYWSPGHPENARCRLE